MPLGKSGVAIKLKIGTCVEVALQIEMVIDRRMNGGKFLQTSHAPKSQHRPFSSSKRLVRILASIVPPTVSFLLLCVANNLYRSAVGSKFVRPDDMRFQKRFIVFSRTSKLLCDSGGDQQPKTAPAKMD